jgi:hypothetical protein
MTAETPDAMIRHCRPLVPAGGRMIAMGVPDPAVYALIVRFLQALLQPPHATSFAAVSALVWAVLCAQSLHPADLVRALPDLTTPHARQAFRRVRRGLKRACFTSHYLTPLLVRAVLRLVPDTAVLVVLDSTRADRWEVFTLGVRCHGRVLPVAWSVLPYPWPTGQFTPTVVALLARTLAGWPPDRPVHLVADRGFPSTALFRQLHAQHPRLALGYTIRLRAGDWVHLADGQTVKVADLVGGLRPGQWRTWAASYPHCQDGPVPTQLVAGRGLPSYPPHQMGPADWARRQARAEARARHLRSKGQPGAVATDDIWCLLTTEATWQAAVTQYSGRFSTEGSYRDIKSWGWEAVVGREPDPAVVDGLTGLAVVSYLVQVSIGAAAGRTRQAGAWARQQQWTTTDRLSIFSRGRLVLHDRAYDWRPWLATVLPALTQRLRSEPQPSLPPTPLPQPRLRQEAA